MFLRSYTLKIGKPERMYQGPIPLSDMKWKHLQEIKATIENTIMHSMSLSYKSDQK